LLNCRLGRRPGARLFLSLLDWRLGRRPGARLFLSLLNCRLGRRPGARFFFYRLLCDRRLFCGLGLLSLLDLNDWFVLWGFSGLLGFFRLLGRDGFLSHVAVHLLS
jgi:hypothetical protein